MVYAYKSSDNELICVPCAARDGGDLTPVKSKKVRGICASCGAAIGRMWALGFHNTWERMYFPTKREAMSEGILEIEYLAEPEEIDQKVKEFRKYGIVDIGNVIMYIELVDAT